MTLDGVEYIGKVASMCFIDFPIVDIWWRNGDKTQVTASDIINNDNHFIIEKCPTS